MRLVAERMLGNGKPHVERRQWLYDFDNGWRASVIRWTQPIHTAAEVAVMSRAGEIHGDVHPFNTDEELAEILAAIEAMPEAPSC